MIKCDGVAFNFDRKQEVIGTVARCQAPAAAAITVLISGTRTKVFIDQTVVTSKGLPAIVDVGLVQRKVSCIRIGIQPPGCDPGTVGRLILDGKSNPPDTVIVTVQSPS